MSNNRTQNGAKLRRRATKRQRKLDTWGNMPHRERRATQARAVGHIGRWKRDNRERIEAKRIALESGLAYGQGAMPFGTVTGRFSSNPANVEPAKPLDMPPKRKPAVISAAELKERAADEAYAKRQAAARKGAETRKLKAQWRKDAEAKA